MVYLTALHIYYLISISKDCSTWSWSCCDVTEDVVIGVTSTSPVTSSSACCKMSFPKPGRTLSPSRLNIILEDVDTFIVSSMVTKLGFVLTSNCVVTESVNWENFEFKLTGQNTHWLPSTGKKHTLSLKVNNFFISMSNFDQINWINLNCLIMKTLFESNWWYCFRENSVLKSVIQTLFWSK